jgi:hypothetical protein
MLCSTSPRHYLGSDHLSCLGLNAVLRGVVHLFLNATIPCYFLRVYVSLDLRTHVMPCAVCRVLLYFMFYILLFLFSDLRPGLNFLNCTTTFRAVLVRYEYQVSPHFQTSSLPARMSRVYKVC